MAKGIASREIAQQNELLREQNNLLCKQNDLIREQNDLIRKQNTPPPHTADNFKHCRQARNFYRKY